MPFAAIGDSFQLGIGNLHAFLLQQRRHLQSIGAKPLMAIALIGLRGNPPLRYNAASSICAKGLSMLEFTPLLQNYTGLMVLSCLFMAATIVVVATNRIVERKARRAFIISAAALIVVSLADWVSVALDGQLPELRLLHTASSAVTFILAPAIPASLVDAIFPKGRVRAIWVLIGLHALLEIASLFGGFVFWVDDANLYHRGPLYLAYIATYFTAGVYLIVQSVRAGRAYQTSNIVAIIAIVVSMASGVFMQLAFSAVHTSWLAVAIALILYFAYYCDLMLRTDPLTLLLNRRTYEEVVANPPHACTVVSLDVDDFKAQNDTYGHSFGDTCLTAVADQIRRTFGEFGHCYRTGGDEFVVFMTDAPGNLESTCEDFARALDELRERDARIPTVSIGTARHEGGDIMAAIDLADQRMYERKRNRKATPSR